MAEKMTVARPYAKAVFEIAKEADAFAGWSDFLGRGAIAAADERVQALIGNPAVTREALAGLFIELCGDGAGAHGASFIKLLAENDRVAWLPEIATEFEVLRAEAENVVDVQLTSAVELDASQRESFATALKKRLGRDVRLHCDTDAKLLGGAIIRAGDLVIDGSLSGRLERLAGAVTH
ncbi:F0F1 ATP synthase subunit delta [Thioalkalivibrio sp. XN279]|uniref:F0F1 ATP synthase subunit delta n=1 Tax=Thioalkalivibrio sp. XN279 TaxID=2714953 RepID=UPI001407AEEB|nr:F0F1 ATP synthase subunit delta [Thioalkalivibrio sp. XN279]NHA15785.1 F0F1 ATP synthase subunit delta [Thioalkalivibrio sp. XN279]